MTITGTKSWETGYLIVRVSDWGCGFDVTKAAATDAGSFGLLRVQEQLALMGGQMAIDSTPGQGTCITLTVLVAPTAQQPPVLPDALLTSAVGPRPRQE